MVNGILLLNKKTIGNYILLLSHNLLVIKMQSDDLHLLRPVKNGPGQELLGQNTESTKENTTHQGNQQHETGQKKDSQHEISNIIPWTGGALVPRHHAFIADSVEKLLGQSLLRGIENHAKHRAFPAEINSPERRRFRFGRQFLKAAELLGGELRGGVGHQKESQAAPPAPVLR